MKDVISLTRAVTDSNFYKEMFEEWGTEKNILFVSPQLSGKHLYKTLLPYFLLRSEEISTAITSLKRFDQRKQLLGYEIDLHPQMIEWADYIVFPFTTQPLVEEIYNSIRESKPEIKIVYGVDFNFYEIPKDHPYHEIFSEEMVISDVEDNMYFADLVLTNNVLLSQYFLEKFKKLTETKYKGVEGYMAVATIPTMIDTEIVLKNIDYNVEKSVSVQAKPTETIHTEDVNKGIEKVTAVAEAVKEKDLSRKEEEKEVSEHVKTYKSPKEKVKKESNNKLEKISNNKKTKKDSHGESATRKSGSKSNTKSTGKPSSKPAAKKRIRTKKGSDRSKK
jgi:hypothetical protein